MNEISKRIACIIMASGLSERYGRNKLLEKLDGREVILHTAGSLKDAGFEPLTVTRNITAPTPGSAGFYALPARDFTGRSQWTAPRR